MHDLGMDAPEQPLATAIQKLLDDVQASLLTQDATQIETASKALVDGFSKLLSGHNKSTAQEAISISEVEALNRRFSQLRQMLAQSASASARQLATLLPERLPSGYGAKTAFSQPGLSTNRRSYQA
jgi:hypothetical protein